MKQHIRLIKSRSYSGIVSATAQKPDLFVEPEVAAEAVATGFFEQVEEPEQTKLEVAAEAVATETVVEKKTATKNKKEEK